MRYLRPPPPSAGGEGRYWDACVHFSLTCPVAAELLVCFYMVHCFFSANLNYINSSKATASQEPRKWRRSPLELFSQGNLDICQSRNSWAKESTSFQSQSPTFLLEIKKKKKRGKTNNFFSGNWFIIKSKLFSLGTYGWKELLIYTDVIYTKLFPIYNPIDFT